jgi:hypothetical protein
MKPKPISLPFKSRYQRLVEKYGYEMAKYIESGLIKEPNIGLKLGSYNSKSKKFK